MLNGRTKLVKVCGLAGIVVGLVVLIYPFLPLLQYQLSSPVTNYTSPSQIVDPEETSSFSPLPFVGLKAAAQETKLITPQTAGLTLRYGIFIRSDCWGDRWLIVHELVHTSQYEKLGGFSQFLKEYLHQCITIGYPEAPMEQEAIERVKQICAAEASLG